MIIYFNFSSSCVELVDQRGEKEMLFLPFDIKYADSRDFKSIIEKTIRGNLKTQLAEDNNIVVLPDCIMGTGLLSVPYSLFKKEENFTTRFNMLYNRDSSLVCDRSIVIGKNLGVTTYAFSAVKKSFLFDISSAFSDMGIALRGFTFYSKLLAQYVCGTLSYTGNSLVIDLGERLSIYGMVRDVPVGQIYLPLREDKVAANYLESVIPDKGKLPDSPFSFKLRTKGFVESAVSDFEEYYSKKGIIFDKKLNLSTVDLFDKVYIDAESVLREAASCRLIGKKGCFRR